ncbi:MAG TPA: hypothetical protein VIO37_04805 [Candidatus Dormibacteraeota bacterium]
MIRRFLLVGAVVGGLVVAAFVGAAAYQALRAPVHVTDNSNLTPENCSPGPCADLKGFTLWVSDIKFDGDLVSMTVKFRNSSTATHASPEDLQLIDASRHVSIPITDLPGCKTWTRQEFHNGATFGPIDICFRVTNTTRPYILHWTPDLGPFCCETNLKIT